MTMMGDAPVGDPSILIAHHHPPARAAMKAILEGGGFHICAEVATARAAIESALRLRPAACIIPVDLPGSGIIATRRIVGHLPEVSIVMLAMTEDDSAFLEAVLAGASGFLLKAVDPDRLPAIVRDVLNGETAMPRALISRLVTEFRARERQRGRLATVGDKKVNLTNREWEVFMGLEEGLTTAEIASRLSVAQVTIRTHISALLKKLDASDREDAVRLIQADPP